MGMGLWELAKRLWRLLLWSNIYVTECIVYMFRAMTL